MACGFDLEHPHEAAQMSGIEHRRLGRHQRENDVRLVHRGRGAQDTPKRRPVGAPDEQRRGEHEIGSVAEEVVGPLVEPEREQPLVLDRKPHRRCRRRDQRRPHTDVDANHRAHRPDVRRHCRPHPSGYLR